MTLILTVKCDAPGCRKRARVYVYMVGGFRRENIEIPFGWYRSTDGENQVCCNTCRHNVNHRRHEQGLERLYWLDSSGCHLHEEAFP